MKIITIASIKGGVGKTALTTFLSQAIRSIGYSVLIIDADANNNLTDYYLRDCSFDEIDKANLYHLIKGESSAGSVTYKTDAGIDIIPCTLQLHKIGIEMSGNPGSILKFSRNIKRLDYDFILIDTPPSLSFEFRMSLHTADLILTPVSFSRWTLQAMLLLKSEIEELKNTYDKAPHLMVVPSIVTDKENETLKNMDFNFSKTYIKKASAIKNALDKAKPLKENSRSYQDFKNLAGELL